MSIRNEHRSNQSSSERPRVSASKRVSVQQQNAGRSAKASQAKSAEQVEKTASRLGAAATATKKTFKHAAESTHRFDADKALSSLKAQTSDSLEAAKNIAPKLGNASSGAKRTTRTIQGSSQAPRGAKPVSNTNSTRPARSMSASSRKSGSGSSMQSHSASSSQLRASSNMRQNSSSRGGSGSRNNAQAYRGSSSKASASREVNKQVRSDSRRLSGGSRSRSKPASIADNQFVHSYSRNKNGIAGRESRAPRGQQKLRGGNPSVGSFASARRGGVVDFLVSFAKNHIPIAAAIALVAVLALGAGFDGLLNKEKIYPGISVGTVDLSGMTEAEAKVAIDDAYSPALVSKKLTVNAVAEKDSQTNSGSADSESSAATKSHSWDLTADKFDASLPAGDLAKSAFAVGREDGGALKRIGLLFGREKIEPYLNIDNDKLEDFANKIDKKVGTPRTDATVSIDNGVATAVDGTDGVVIDRDELKSFINEGFLTSAEENPSKTLTVASASSRTTLEQATNMAETINNAISDGLELSYDGKGWKVDAETLGEWTEVGVTEDSKGIASLEAKLKTASLESSILKKVVSLGKTPKTSISFEATNNQVTVHTDGQGQIPMVEEAAQSLSGLYATNQKCQADVSRQPDGAQANDGVPVKIAIQAGPTPSEMTLEKAKLCGVVQKIATYKTDYEGGDDEAARVHNIHRASDLLNNSIVRANGGQWSFHETAGECNKANGFEAAGVVVNGQIEQDYGGGICQVATTVFNAVYEAGLPVVRRHNHSLYVATYPDGRDAAVSWPDLDFIWENDLSSDILVVMGYTGGSVTCTLYGVDPHRQVTTKTGSWKKGQKYGETNIVDTSIGSDTWYIKNEGRDGSSITVWRTVRDSSGKTLYEDTFESNYDPKNQVNVFGSQKLLNSYAKS